MVTLESLCGTHALHGAPRMVRMPLGSGDGIDGVVFSLDGRVYMAIEDESDGYRSMLDRVIEISDNHDFIGRYEFKLDVLCRMASNDSDTVLEMLDLQTGATVMRLGTEDVTDYYPSFVFEWTPPEVAAARAAEQAQR